MNRELDNLAQIIDNLPEELEYFGIIKDLETKEFIFFNNVSYDADYTDILKTINNNNYPDDKITLFGLAIDIIASLDDLFLLSRLENVINNTKNDLLKNEQNNNNNSRNT